MLNKNKSTQKQMESELLRQIEVKRREQHLCTRAIVEQAEAKVRDAQRRIDMCIGNRERCIHEKEMNERNIEIVMQIADRNRREYEHEIDVLQDKIKLQRETDEEVKLNIELGLRHKYACFKIAGSHLAMKCDIMKAVYEGKGVKQPGFIEQIESHLIDAELSEYDIDIISGLYKRLLRLFDLRMDVQQPIFDLYKIAVSLPQIGCIREFVEACKVVYVIPAIMSKMTWLSNVLKDGTPICQDNICDILSYLNDGVVDKKTIDTMVYEY
jgi:hypothetical protein